MSDQIEMTDDIMKKLMEEGVEDLAKTIAQAYMHLHPDGQPTIMVIPNDPEAYSISFFIKDRGTNKYFSCGNNFEEVNYDQNKMHIFFDLVTDTKYISSLDKAGANPVGRATIDMTADQLKGRSPTIDDFLRKEKLPDILATTRNQDKKTYKQ